MPDDSEKNIWIRKLKFGYVTHHDNWIKVKLKHVLNRYIRVKVDGQNVWEEMTQVNLVGFN